MLCEVLQNQKLTEASLSRGTVPFSFRAVATERDEFVLRKRAAVIFHELLKLASSSARESHSPIGGVLQHRLQRPVHNEIRIPPNGRCEVGIVLTRKREVPNDCRAVLRLGKRSQNGEVNRSSRRMLSSRIQKLLQVVSRRIIRHAETSRASFHPEIGHVFERRFGMDAAEDRHPKRIKDARHGLVGLNHEHLDDGVRKSVIFLLYIGDMAIVIECHDRVR